MPNKYPDWFLGNIPEYMQEGAFRYLMEGVRPGNFLSNVLANDFREALQSADSVNEHYLHEWVYFLNMIPSEAWGSREAVDRWCKQGGINGLERPANKAGG